MRSAHHADRGKAGDRSSYLFSGRILPLPLFLLPPILPPTHPPPPPSYLCFSQNTAQTGRWRQEGKEPPRPPRTAHPCVHPSRCWHPHPDSSSPAHPPPPAPRPFSSAQAASTVICLPISIPGPSLSLPGSQSTPLISLLKWLPGHCTLALQWLRTQRSGGGPPSRVFIVWGYAKFLHLSLHRVGRRQPTTPKVEPADRLRGKWGGRTIQVQRHGDGGSGWSRALAGEGAPTAAARGCIEESAGWPLCAHLHGPRPPHPRQSFRSGLGPPRPLAPAPSSIVTETQGKPDSRPARPAREPTVKTSALWPCPCLRGPIRSAGNAPDPPGTASSSASGSFPRSAETRCGNFEPPKIRH